VSWNGLLIRFLGTDTIIMTRRSFRWLLLSLALLAVSVDLCSKYAVFRWLYASSWLYRSATTNEYVRSASYDLIPGVFQFYVDYRPEAEMCDCWFVKMNGPVPPRVNYGALYGIGNGHEKTANYLFAAISLLAAGAIIWWGSRASTRRDPLLCAALGLILGGTMGNLFDRIVFGGVRDFLHWYLFEFPVFNVADSCLVCGACLLLFHAMFIHPSKKEAVEVAAAKPAEAP
jgi:signal peptidase II